jgi:C_GCAxxG_C_C family probable redox protein
MKDIVEEVFKYWENNSNCAMADANGILDFYGYPEYGEVMRKAFLPFGGGVGERSICGAALGALPALSFLLSEKGLTYEEIGHKTKLFKKRFNEEMGTIYCREIILDFIQPDGSVDKDNPERRKLCDKAVAKAALIVKEIMDGI